MNYCSKCGNKLDVNAKFCFNCGEKVNRQDNKELDFLKKHIEEIEELIHIRINNKPAQITSPADEEKIMLYEEKVVNAIKTINIPNSIDVISEIIIIAASKINSKVFNSASPSESGEITEYEVWVSRKDSTAWFLKMEEAYNKASILFRNAPEFERLEDIYLKTKKDIERERKKGQWATAAIVIFSCGIILLFIIMVIKCY